MMMIMIMIMMVVLDIMIIMIMIMMVVLNIMMTIVVVNIMMFCGPWLALNNQTWYLSKWSSHGNVIRVPMPAPHYTIYRAAGEDKTKIGPENVFIPNWKSYGLSRQKLQNRLALWQCIRWYLFGETTKMERKVNPRNLMWGKSSIFGWCRSWPCHCWQLGHIWHPLGWSPKTGQKLKYIKKMNLIKNEILSQIRYKVLTF